MYLLGLDTKPQVESTQSIWLRTLTYKISRNTPTGDPEEFSVRLTSQGHYLNVRARIQPWVIISGREFCNSMKLENLDKPICS